MSSSYELLGFVSDSLFLVNCHFFKPYFLWTLCVQGTKVLVWGGQSSDPENPDCHLSTEEYDLKEPELGWNLKENMTNDPSLCEVQFICEEHESLKLNCKWANPPLFPLCCLGISYFVLQFLLKHRLWSRITSFLLCFNMYCNWCPSCFYNSSC